MSIRNGLIILMAAVIGLVGSAPMAGAENLESCVYELKLIESGSDTVDLKVKKRQEPLYAGDSLVLEAGGDPIGAIQSVESDKGNKVTILLNSDASSGTAEKHAYVTASSCQEAPPAEN